VDWRRSHYIAYEESWGELQQGIVTKVSLAFVAVAWLGWYRVLLNETRDGRLMVVLVAGAAFCLAAALSKALSHQWKAVVQVATSFAGVYAVGVELGYQAAIPFFVVPILLSAVLLGPWMALVVSLAACLAVSANSTVWEGATFPFYLLFALVGAIATLQMHDLGDALSTAWRHTETAVGLAQQVRLRRLEVIRLNKSLKVSNQLLKRSLRELALAQREAQEARHLKEQFATTVSHELRTPLSIILGFVDVMQHHPEVYEKVKWTPALRRDIGEIQRSAMYLSTLVDDILDLARIQALKMPIHREPTQLSALIDEVVSMASRLLLKKPDVRLSVNVPRGLPCLHIDPVRIRQVLLNLLANACRFTDEGEIEINVEPTHDEVIVSVRDTGSGIPAEQLRVIFDDFSQVPSCAPCEGQGWGKGLGLAIARRFVQMHGGRIWAESEPGRGSTFYLTLPLEEKRVVSLATPPLSDMPDTLEAPTVVLVGDGKGQRFLSRYLEHYQVVTVPNLHEARKIVQARHPRAVIVNVPPESEDATLGASPRILPEPVPLIQCSLPVWHWHMEADIFDDWLVKPVNSESLLSTLARFCSEGRLLIVDDDRAFVRLVKRILDTQSSQYEILWAYDGNIALEMLEREPVDVILLDIALPGLDGRSIARTVREKHSPSTCAIVAVTALQPGLEGSAMTPRTFAVTSSTGFSEEEILNLIHSALTQLEPAFTPEWSQPVREGEQGGTLAS